MSGIYFNINEFMNSRDEWHYFWTGIGVAMLVVNIVLSVILISFSKAMVE